MHITCNCERCPLVSRLTNRDKGIKVLHALRCNHKQARPRPDVSRPSFLTAIAIASFDVADVSAQLGVKCPCAGNGGNFSNERSGRTLCVHFPTCERELLKPGASGADNGGYNGPKNCRRPLSPFQLRRSRQDWKKAVRDHMNLLFL